MLENLNDINNEILTVHDGNMQISNFKNMNAIRAVTTIEISIVKR
jgi:hypothetical protein